MVDSLGVGRVGDSADDSAALMAGKTAEQTVVEKDA